jgi:putative SOS response-associated peptidase YedK
MCNLYSQKRRQTEVRHLTKALRDLAGNVPELTAISPNRTAPIVRNTPGGVRELIMARWGFPPPDIDGQKLRNPYFTKVRKTDSLYWLPYLQKTESRCLVPVTSFAAPDYNQGPRPIWTWFARDDNRPLMFFAGIWREWEGDRGTQLNPLPGPHLLFSFLTTVASPDVAPIHSDAMPVLLLDETAREEWMTAPWDIARKLQKPPPDGALKIVCADTKEDAY